jgi:hypothetical protein
VNAVAIAASLFFGVTRDARAVTAVVWLARACLAALQEAHTPDPDPSCVAAAVCLAPAMTVDQDRRRARRVGGQEASTR